MKKSSDILKGNISSWLNEDRPISETETQLTEDALIRYAQEHATPPSQEIRNIILDKIKRFNQFKKERSQIELSQLPVLDANSNLVDWQEVVREIEPIQPVDDYYLHPLASNGHRQLYVAWVKTFSGEEVLPAPIESLFLLEGSLKCHIHNQKGESTLVRIRMGDFIAIHPDETYEIVVTSPEFAKVILQLGEG